MFGDSDGPVRVRYGLIGGVIIFSPKFDSANERATQPEERPFDSSESHIFATWFVSMSVSSAASNNCLSCANSSAVIAVPSLCLGQIKTNRYLAIV